MRTLFYIRSRAEIENRKRLRLCVAAYAYEFESQPIMSDGDFDALAQTVDLSIHTRHQDWWEKEFNPSTGQWIHTHPELDGVRRLFHAHYHS